MKRSEALVLIANQLDFLNGKFEGFRINYHEEDLKACDVILTTLEAAGMQPPIRADQHGSIQWVDLAWEEEPVVEDVD